MEHIRIVPSEGQHMPHHSRAWHRSEGIKRTHSRSSTSSRPTAYACPSPRRCHTTACHDHCEVHRDPEPWSHMAKTYAWVMEQEIAEMARQNEETVRWILKQQQRDLRERLMFAVWGMETRYWDILETLEEEMTFDTYNPYRRKPRDHEFDFHGVSHATDIQTAVEDEIGRLHARRRETEKCRAAYDRRKALEEQRERERRKQRQERGRLEREQAERLAWKEYEAKWNTLASIEGSEEQLAFETIPWPLVVPPRTVEDIRPARIAMFLLSTQHSEEQSRKDRIRSALRRWHPDRFGRVLARVREEDKEKVAEGAGIVARCLNNLLERTS